MFVRWKRYKGAYSWQSAERRYDYYRARSAVVVQSVRTAAGPRLKHICYLGSISEGHEHDALQREWFWGGVERNLDKAGIAGATRERIVARLEAIVPRPEPEPERPPYNLEAERRKLATLIGRTP
jgi:hypothetical protein